jgi:hypothetical protein
VKIEGLDGWPGWLGVRARAPGIEVKGSWAPNGDAVFPGLPDLEYVVTVEGSDSDRRRLFGEIRARPGVPATLRATLR